MNLRHFAMFGATLLLATSPALMAQETIEKGVNYLANQQSADGGWDSDEKLKLIDTSESFQALLRARGGENALNKALQFFSRLTPDNNEIAAYKLRALSSSTADVASLANQLIAAQKSDGGWGIADAKQGSIPHTIIAVNALIAAQKSTASTLNSALTFFAKNQQPDGAWIFSSETSLSDTAHTAMVLAALKNIQSAGQIANMELEQAITKARSYLEAKNSAGSYGDIIDTAWTYLAFSQIKQPSELQQTLSIINNAQLENGSWNNKIYDTAICLQALAAIQAPQTDLPDLEISEQNISFNPAAPLTGNEVTITATVFNSGELDAENVKIEFFNRDPRLDGVEIAPAKTIALIPAGGSSSVSSSFISTGMVGQQQIVVFIDRENAVREISKANNAAAKILPVGGMPDLSVSTGDIILSNPNPAAFETVDLIVTIHNTGNEAVENIPVKIFDNDQLISEFILSGVNAGNTNKAIITTGFSAENHVIRVEVDPDHAISNEVNLTNNTASITFNIEKEAEKPLDIAVESIVFDPAAPMSTSPAKITVTIVNLGGIDATTAFNTTLSVDGTAVGSISVPQLPGQQKAILSFENITLAAGERTITAVADSGNAVTADTNRTNNIMTSTITVRDSATPADLEVLSFTATPATTSPNSTVSFKVTVKNNGTTAAENVVVKLFNGTTPLGNGITVPRLVGGQSAELQFEHAFSSNGNYAVRAVTDPDNKIAESNETNNEKSATVTVTGTSDLEITAQNIILSVDTITAFQQFEIIAVIKNIGNMDAVNIPVRFVANGEPLMTMNLSGVAAGGSNKAILKTSLPKGTYNITIQIDPDKTLANEHNLTNNVAYKQFVVTAPVTSPADIAVEKLVIDPALPLQNAEVNLTATIINAGGTDIATAFVVEFKDGETVLHSFTVPALAAGQKAELKLAAAFAAGEHSVSIVADPANVITEASEENNTLSRQITVQSTATPPDLTVQSITMDRETVNVMDKIVFTAAIYNAGTTTAENFHVRVVVNGETYGEDTRITSLPGGGTFQLQIPYTVVKQDGNTIQVIADSQNSVEEGDEANNTGTLNFSASTVPRPDLTIPDGGLVSNPASPQPGVGFDYKITVSNLGNASAEASKLRITSGHPQMAGTTILAELDIPAIAAGASAVVTAKLNFDTDKEIFIFVDSDDALAESNESNNLFTTSISVTALPDLMVDVNSISLSHTDMAQGNTIGVTVLVSNIGTVASTASRIVIYLGALESSSKTALGTLEIPVLAPGAHYEAKVLWNALPGEQKISAVVDPENQLTEASKTNNSAVKNVIIDGAQVSVVKLYTVPADGSAREEKYTYGTYQDIEIDLTHFWGEGSKPYLFVLDSSGGVHAVSEVNGKYYWNTANAAPGAYRVRLQMVSKEMFYADVNGFPIQHATLLEEQYVNFQITNDGKVVKVTKISNNPTYSFEGKTAEIKVEAELLNYSNVDQNLVIIRRLKSPTGDILQTENFDLLLKPNEIRKAISLGTITQQFTVDGTYQIEVEIQEGGATIAGLSSDFTVLNNANITVRRQVVPDKITPEGNRRVRVIIELDAVEQE